MRCTCTDPADPISDATTGLAYDLTAQTWSTRPYPSGTAPHLATRLVDDGRRHYFLKATITPAQAATGTP